MCDEILKIKKLSKTAKIPRRATHGSAGLDLYASLQKPVSLPVNGVVMIPCGISMQIMENYVGLICIRSGISTKFDITLANGIGVIDSDYRGEICVSLRNCGKNTYTINNNDRVAQILILKHATPKISLCDNLDQTSRGSNGFGSTGK